MQLRNTADTYGALAKFLHWTIVILIIAQYVIIEAAEELPDGLEKLTMITRHKSHRHAGARRSRWSASAGSWPTRGSPRPCRCRGPSGSPRRPATACCTC